MTPGFCFVNGQTSAGAPHTNFKFLMSERVGLDQALRQAGMQFEGTAHRGIDDACNIARLLPLLFDADGSESESLTPRPM